MKTQTVITLTWFELFAAACHGSRRQIEALKRERKEVYGKTANGAWESHIIGAMAEMALAKHLNIFWKAVVTNPEELPGDVGEFQVRSTTYSDGCLILHDRDKNDARFYLVIANPPEFRIVGSIMGKDGKKPEYWSKTAPRPAFFVPQNVLE